MQALVRSMLTPDSAAEPAIVISNRPEAGGLAKAERLGVPTAIVDHRGFKSRAEFDAELHRVLIGAEADMVALAGFMRIMTDGMIDLWQGRMLNIHPSLLPAFTGLNTHARAKDAGCAVHGCTVHEVTAELDAGPILGQGVLAIRADETEQDLIARVQELEHRLYPRVLQSFIQDPAAIRRQPVAIADSSLAS